MDWELIAIFLISFPFQLFLVLKIRKQQNTAAFFHPFTLDGGGGERVLWCAVRALQRKRKDVQVVIYTGDACDGAALAKRAADTFGTPPLRPIRVVRLRLRYPVLTLLGQALGSVVLTLEALCKCNPDCFIDTAGYAFSYPIAWSLGTRVIAYVHYPMISTDMLDRVRIREVAFNNSALVARSPLLSRGKVHYYTALASLYGAAGRFAHVVMVNSSWTKAHIDSIWKVSSSLVYPPCNTTDLQKLPLQRTQASRPSVVSVAQFRPEKAHKLQLEAWVELKRLAKERKVKAAEDAVLHLVGGVRGREDEARLKELKQYAIDLGLNPEPAGAGKGTGGVQSSVEFQVGVPFSALRGTLGAAAAGVHTMRDEHFGIGVVEYMAAGAVPVAHNSAGPKMDIIIAEEGQQRPGFLAETALEYAEALITVLAMPAKDREKLAALARARAAKFSDEAFEERFIDALLGW